MRVNTVSQSLEEINRRVTAYSDTPILDAQVLIAHITHQSRAWVLAHPEYFLSISELEALDIATIKLESGMPLPYILGSWEFYGRKFFITPDVLIPRPETELLVEKALAWLVDHSGMNDNILAADIGCGSGCIGISLALGCPTLYVIASDISASALRVTSRNAGFYSITNRFHPIQCDLIPPIAAKFHLICANLPYIPSPTLSHLKVFKKEPTLALDGGADGLDIITRLLLNSTDYLAPYGLMILEIETSQGVMVKKLAQAAFPHAAIHLFQDLAGHDRVISIQQGK